MSFIDNLKKFKKPAKKEKSKTIRIKSGVFEKEFKKYLGKKYSNNGKGRAEGVHCSQIPYLCARKEYALSRIDPLYFKPPQPAQKARTQAKWDIGTLVHLLYQNDYLADMKVIKGSWRCCSCSAVYGSYENTDLVFKPDRCIAGGNGCNTSLECKSNEFNYIEPGVCYEDLTIVGHCDGIVELDGVDYVLEMKTMDSDGFRNLSYPYDSHIEQANCYSFMLDIPRILFVYIDKSSKSKVIKDFMLDFSPTLWENTKRKVSYYLETLKNAKVLPDRVCKDKDDPYCRFCSFKKVCFEDGGIEDIIINNPLIKE